MKLIILNGKPGVGKNTIARKIAINNTFKVIDATSLINLVFLFYEYRTKELVNLIYNIRLLLLHDGYKNDINIIFTLSYCNTIEDMNGILSLYDFCLKNNINIKIINLYCQNKENLERIISPSRKNLKKIKSKKGFLESIKKFNYSSIDFIENVSIDNTNLSPARVSNIILKL